ncbi:hypothetical protein [Actinacidiphila oryziradicis]|uniref:Uncharacterized protein n=1 Tax=Actinacidiphila oryziradicis TaxID=2571141 RepID=A0A4U0RR54_9ACTN|nr:hypothetical protein [Actinacidiphila oryziradicis]TJZ97812.1 hypothetical protein FCI23_49300 [Actinacidiphila oryziradicis]
MHAAELAAAATGADPLDNPEWRAWCEQRQQAAAVWESVVAAVVRTDEDRRAARAAALFNPQLVIDHLDDDENDAIDLYGIELAAQCTGLNASSNVQLGVFL